MTTTLDIQAFLNEVNKGVPLFDVRSPNEFAAGHVPGAISLPLLNDEERHQVGLTFKQAGKDAAVSLGFRLVGHKFIDYIDAAKAMSLDGKVCFHCWRGGVRSSTMAWLMSSVGLEVYVLEGGYKEFRRWCLKWMEHPWNILIVSGKTGAGKTDILHALRERGEAIIDLEALANHRGSAFGGLGLTNQPTQEAFENALAWELSNKVNASRLWIENESRFIGKLRIPDAFFTQASKSAMITIDRDVHSRAKRILNEYGHFDADVLAEKTKSITKRMGGDRVKASIDALEAGDMMGWVMPLLDYYDRNYEYSNQERTGKYERVLHVKTESSAQIANELLRLNPR